MLPAKESELKLDAPGELAAFVNEPFYAPLATRLTSPAPEDQLSAREKQQLANYRASKTALQSELLARLYTLKEVDRAARILILEAFAREQMPGLVELERIAERLRRDFIRVSRNGGADDPIRPAQETLATQFARLRTAVFFDDSLSPAFRRFLREIIIEMDETARGKKFIGGVWDFFSPDTARVQWPSPLPTELAAKVSDYEQAKNALKNELRDLLCAAGPTIMTTSRSQALETMAASEAPRIAVLEQLAEEIRRGLQELTIDPLQAPHLPSLPPGMEDRIAAYRKEKLALQKALLTQVHQAGNPEAPRDPAAAPEKVRQTIDAFTRDHAARYAALEREKEDIRNALARAAAVSRKQHAGHPADRLLQEFADSFQQFELWRLYYEYRIAVYQPGLSPEQRRLLFDNAMEKLELPLPGGTLEPD